MFVAKVLRWGALIASVLVTVGCQPPDPPGPECFVTAPVQAKPPSDSEPLAVIYLDSSESMAGFVSPDAHGVFSRTLLELRNVAGLASPQLRPIVRQVAGSIGTPNASADELNAAAVNPGFYKGSETNLTGAMAEITRGKPARVAVLVTDGVQSTAARTASADCTRGSDPVCFRNRVREMLEHGWSGTVVGLRSQFHGPFFSEVNQAGGQTYRLHYDSREGNPATYRPFYLYVFSPDAAALAMFTSTLRARLESFVERGSMHELPLSCSLATGPSQAEAHVTGPAADNINVRPLNRPGAPVFTVHAGLDIAPPANQLELAIDLPWSPEIRSALSPEERNAVLEWTVKPVTLAKGCPVPDERTKRLGRIEVAGVTTDKDGKYHVRLLVNWPPKTGAWDWQVYRLTAAVKPGLQSAPLPWIKNWSTDLDTTPESANKTLLLETQLLGLWQNPAITSQVAGEVYLRLGSH